MDNEIYIYENDTYGVQIGASLSKDDDSLVFQVVSKEHGVIEFESRELGQACFRANVNDYMWQNKEWEVQFGNYVASQKAADAVELSGDNTVAEEPLPGEKVVPIKPPVKQ